MKKIFKKYGSLTIYLLFLIGSVLLIPRAGDISQPLIDFTIDHWKTEANKAKQETDK